MAFPPKEPETKPEGFRATIRLMVERLLAVDPSDIAVLQALREASTQSRAALLRYMRGCFLLVEKLLGGRDK
jgi:hypothetical protein